LTPYPAQTHVVVSSIPYSASPTEVRAVFASYGDIIGFHVYPFEHSTGSLALQTNEDEVADASTGADAGAEMDGVTTTAETNAATATAAATAATAVTAAESEAAANEETSSAATVAMDAETETTDSTTTTAVAPNTADAMDTEVSATVDDAATATVDGTAAAADDTAGLADDGVVTAMETETSTPAAAATVVDAAAAATAAAAAAAAKPVKPPHKATKSEKLVLQLGYTPVHSGKVVLMYNTHESAAAALAAQDAKPLGLGGSTHTRAVRVTYEALSEAKKAKGKVRSSQVACF
jgi:hypothetical protein